jgi:uncharacterized protein involved in outer membrane biogenesis
MADPPCGAPLPHRETSRHGSPRRRTVPHWRLCAALAAVVLLLGPALLLAALQAGLLDRTVQRELSAVAGRRITFAHLRSSVFSPTPAFTVDDLAIGSPPAISQALLLTAPQAVLRIRLFAALTGRPRAFEVTLVRPVAHLVRLAPGRNNYSLGPGGASTGWRRLARLEVAAGSVRYDDPARHATLDGVFTHRPDPADPRPFHLSGGGTINDESFVVDAKGASLAGRDPTVAYPFEAVLQDGGLRAAVAGTSGKPFDFRKLDLRLQAAGPNLADFTYLVQAIAPNTPAFSLSAHLVRSDPALALTDIVARIGASDVRGALSSDHPPGTRRSVRATLRSDSLYLRDLRVMLSPRPAHSQTRMQPGAAPPKAPGSGMFSSTPFKTEAMKRIDLRLQVAAARLPDAPFAVRDLDTLLVLKSGRLSLSPTTFSTAPGAVSASFVLDASRPMPLVTIAGHVRGARLASVKPGLARTADADLDLDVDLSGEGVSLHAAASRLQGRLALRMSHGRLDRAKAAALGGDLIKAVTLSLGGKGPQASLDCAVADFTAAAGRLQARDLVIVTDAGWAHGEGDVDLAHETVALALQGAPAHPRPFQVNAPVHVSGSLSHPAVGIDPVRGLDRLAASLPFGKPSPPAPDCAALLARSTAFAGPSR